MRFIRGVLFSALASMFLYSCSSEQEMSALGSEEMYRQETSSLESEEGYDQRIRDIEAIRRFGEDLGLQYGYAFEELDLSDGSRFYWVYAAHKDTIESAIDNKGYPYLFFGKDKTAAERKVKELKEEGYDTLLIGRTAHGNSSQITKSLLETTLAHCAYTILHEGFHNHARMFLCIPGELEEEIADYIGFHGAIEFFRRHKPEFVHEAEALLDHWSEEAKFVKKYHNLLSECYKNGGADREEIFRRAEEERDTLYRNSKSKYFRDKWVNKELPRINNAYFIQKWDYVENRDLVSESLGKNSIEDYLASPWSVNAYLEQNMRTVK